MVPFVRKLSKSFHTRGKPQYMYRDIVCFVLSRIFERMYNVEISVYLSALPVHECLTNTENKRHVLGTIMPLNYFPVAGRFQILMNPLRFCPPYNHFPVPGT